MDGVLGSFVGLWRVRFKRQDFPPPPPQTLHKRGGGKNVYDKLVLSPLGLVPDMIKGLKFLQSSDGGLRVARYVSWCFSWGWGWIYHVGRFGDSSYLSLARSGCFWRWDCLEFGAWLFVIGIGGYVKGG